MKPNDATDLDGCELILELIAYVDRRIARKSEADFLADKDEIDLTAFRLSIIGETSHRFSEAFKSRHPDVPWRSIYGMRNVISYNYANLDPAAVWRVANLYIGKLAMLCREEVDRLS